MKKYIFSLLLTIPIIAFAGTSTDLFLYNNPKLNRTLHSPKKSAFCLSNLGIIASLGSVNEAKDLQMLMSITWAFLEDNGKASQVSKLIPAETKRSNQLINYKFKQWRKEYELAGCPNLNNTLQKKYMTKNK